MKALTSSASNVILDKYRDRGFVSSKEFYRNRPYVLYLSFKKLVTATRFLQHKALQPISALSSDAQAEQETVAQTQTTQESKTVHVKFQLQKKCLFGEQFFLVGDDPMIGLWEPTSAIPMEWSDGHIWTVELDIPVEKSIQFKFILKESTGDIVWQPDPDRILQTWETKNTITVCEDWENAEYQKIIEEYPTVNSETSMADNFAQSKEAPVSDNMSVGVDTDVNSAKVPEKPISVVAENIGYPKKDPVSNASNKMIGEKQISESEEELGANKKTTTEDVLGNNGRAATVKNLSGEKGHSKEDLMLNASHKMLAESQVSQPEEEMVANKNMTTEEDALGNNGRAAAFMNLTAENIGDQKEDLVLNASNNMVGEKQISQAVEESFAKENMMNENVLKNNGRTTMVKDSDSTYVKGNLITEVGDAVLVPELTSLPMPDEGEIEDENQKSVLVDASVGNLEAVNHNVPQLEERQEPQINQHEEEKVEIFNEEEQHQLDDEQKHQTSHSAKQEQQPDAKPLESNVLEHDIERGLRTVQTFLSNLGLL